MLEVARKHHLEGIVAKSITSTYQPGKRSSSWLKTPLRATTEGIICGFVFCEELQSMHDLLGRSSRLPALPPIRFPG